MSGRHQPDNGADSATALAETVRQDPDQPFQRGEPCPFPRTQLDWRTRTREAIGPCNGTMEPYEYTERLGGWTGPEVTRRTWACTGHQDEGRTRHHQRHLACQGPGCRQLRLDGPTARYCSDACRLRAWRRDQRLKVDHHQGLTP